MTIRTISKQPTGGATEKKDQLEWTTDGPSARRSLVRNVTVNRWTWLCASCVPDFRFG